MDGSGGTKSGLTYGATDDLAIMLLRIVHVRDLPRFCILGIDYQFKYKFKGLIWD